MKFKDYADLKDNEAALLDYNGELISVSVTNEAGGVCDCCRNFETNDCDLIKVVNVVTGDQVWPKS